jgi:hypothetical protein
MQSARKSREKISPSKMIYISKTSTRTYLFVLNFKGIYFNFKKPRIYEKLFILNFSSEHPYDNWFVIRANTEVILTLNTVIGPVVHVTLIDIPHSYREISI